MAFENVVAQTTREAPSALMRETFIAPKMLPVCCVCELIRDETASSLIVSAGSRRGRIEGPMA